MKKILCVILSMVLMFGLMLPAFAVDPSQIDSYVKKFVKGEGPKVDGISIDYVSFTPKLKGKTKYPLVIWLHGAGDGTYNGDQVEDNNFALWASDEFQSRFKPAGGAFLLVPRAEEAIHGSWGNNYIAPLKAMIDDFISKNAARIDLKRIYIGGYSMGGKMTLKMAASYPEMFAAAFPICPFYSMSQAEAKAISKMPVWLTVSHYDVLAGYYTFSQENWNKIRQYSAVPNKCRLSLIGIVYYPDGKKAPTNHHAWYPVTADMFTYDGKAYYDMTTCDANNKEVTLRYPNGMISWLSSFTSNFTGQSVASTGTANKNTSTSVNVMTVLRIARAIIADLIQIIVRIIT